MVKGFWRKLNRPISVLAPMFDVTDVVFRTIVAETARPDVFFTEFVNAEAFNSKGKDMVLQKLALTQEHRPIVAQIWGSKPENFYNFAKALSDMGFDGIDLNFGCPEKSVLKLGLCSALIENRPLAKEIIQATIEGAGELPVSLKTRTGIKTHTTENWFTFLLDFDLSAITLHARTVKQLSEVPANWDEIKKAVDIKKKLNKDILIIGNGDVQNSAHGAELCAQYGADGFMIGRGIFSDLKAFDKTASHLSKEEKLAIMKHHIELYSKTYGSNKNYNVLKKYYKIYINGFDGAAKMREDFMQTQNADEALALF